VRHASCNKTLQEGPSYAFTICEHLTNIAIEYDSFFPYTLNLHPEHVFRPEKSWNAWVCHCRSQDPTERFRALQALLQDVAQTITATGPQGFFRTLQGARAFLEIGQSYIGSPEPPQVCAVSSAAVMRGRCHPRSYTLNTLEVGVLSWHTVTMLHPKEHAGCSSVCPSFQSPVIHLSCHCDDCLKCRPGRWCDPNGICNKDSTWTFYMPKGRA